MSPADSCLTRYIPSRKAQIFAAILIWLLRIFHASWQKDIIGLHHIQRAIDKGDLLLVTFWHGKYVPLFPLFEGIDTCILTSRSFRGDIIAAISAGFGFNCIEIPEHASAGITTLIEKVTMTHHCLGIAVDGPLGPYHRVKAGLVRLASSRQFLVAPVSVVMRRKIVLRKRWDKMEIPLPFSRVSMAVGEPFKVPAALEGHQLETWRNTLKENIERADRLAESGITE